MKNDIPLLGQKRPPQVPAPQPHAAPQVPVVYVNGFAASTGGVDAEFALMLGEQYAIRLLMPLAVARMLGEACADLVQKVEQATDTTILSSETIAGRMQSYRPTNN